MEVTHHQLDQHWVARYRQLISYDAYWWWAQAGPFTHEEQATWDQLIVQQLNGTKNQLSRLIAHSREREFTVALAEGREPELWYPVLQHSIGEVREHIADLQRLDAEILRNEPHSIVRHLYHDTIVEEIRFLHLLEATYLGNNERYWELTRLLYAQTTRDEMEYPLAWIKNVLLAGLQHRETVAPSQSLIQMIREQLQLPNHITHEEIAQALQVSRPLPAPEIQQMVSAQSVKRFFEQILKESGYSGWGVEIDPKATNASISSAARRVTLQETPVTLKQVRHLLSHEIAGHVARSSAGEQSPLGILAFGTAGYRPTEEGLALYNERRTAALNNEEIDSGSWFGTLAVGLATGVLTPPQTFLSLFSFFELLLLIFRLLKRLDPDVEVAKKQARKRALNRCLRTFRGVPDLRKAGIAYTKDVVYLRGFRLIEQAVAQDETVLDQLAIGKIALEQLELLRELKIVAPPQKLRERAFDPDLNAYILSFEQK